MPFRLTSHIKANQIHFEANDFFRSAFGAAMPIVASPLFKNLKVDWGCSLLGFISCIFIPIPIFLYKFGRVARKHSKYAQSPV